MKTIEDQLFDLSRTIGIFTREVASDIVKIEDRLSNLEDKPKPSTNFKVGMWAAFVVRGAKYLFYITKFDGDMVIGNSFEEGTKEGNQCTFKSMVSVTPKEIEDYLKLICDKKYIGKTTKCRMDGFISKILRFVNYTSTLNIDSLWYINTNGGYVKVYGQGKFAEIIPDKKPLPRNKLELRNFFREFSANNLNINEFLNQYEDKL